VNDGGVGQERQTIPRHRDAVRGGLRPENQELLVAEGQLVPPCPLRNQTGWPPGIAPAIVTKR